MQRYPSVVLTLIVVTGAFACRAEGTREDNEFGQRISMRRVSKGTPRSKLSVVATPTTANCTDATPYNAYRFIEGVDPCLQLLSAATLAQLQDPFAVNVLQKGVGQPDLWPSSVEQIVSRLSAISGFAANQKSYLLGEGSQITARFVSRDASRNLRYVITWGANSSPSVFLSAAPTGTHPGRPAPFLQVIGYDPMKNVFNYYRYVSNDDVLGMGNKQATRTWTWAGDSTSSRNAQSAGQGCFACHINGALNMKELVTPWNNWGSPRATISAVNIPAAVAQDPLYTTLSGADVLQNNFQNLQSRYTQGLVASSIQNGTINSVPALLDRLINTTTINFQSSFSKPVDSTDVQMPPDFFVFHSALTMPQINLLFTMPQLTITRSTHDAFVSQHKFALQQLNSDTKLDYQQPGTDFFAFFVPVPPFEDMVAIRELINQRVIDANFAASVLLVDFPNPVFSAQRSSLMKYAEQIPTAQVLANGSPNPNGVPAQFIALVTAAAKSQLACDPSALASCTPEQQFLHFAGQSDWQQRAVDQINPYFAAIGGRIGSATGATDYLMMSVSRQSQFRTAPSIGNLDEFSLLFPCSDLTFTKFKRMNVDGTTGDDPLWPPVPYGQSCVSAQ
jgi:hypothetical protein